MKERLFEIWLSLRCGVANPAFIPLLKAYTPYELFSAGEDVINDLPCDDRLKRALCDKNLEESHRIQRYCQTNGIGIIFSISMVAMGDEYIMIGKRIKTKRAKRDSFLFPINIKGKSTNAE